MHIALHPPDVRDVRLIQKQLEKEMGLQGKYFMTPASDPESFALFDTLAHKATKLFDPPDNGELHVFVMPEGENISVFPDFRTICLSKSLLSFASELELKVAFGHELCHMDPRLEETDRLSLAIKDDSKKSVSPDRIARIRHPVHYIKYRKGYESLSSQVAMAAEAIALAASRKNELFVDRLMVKLLSEHTREEIAAAYDSFSKKSRGHYILSQDMPGHVFSAENCLKVGEARFAFEALKDENLEFFKKQKPSTHPSRAARLRNILRIEPEEKERER